MAHIDWLTIVGRREAQPADWTVNSAYLTACEWIEARSASFTEAFDSPMGYSIVRPRAPYSYARRSTDNTRTLYVHPLAAHFTFEASGTHCGRIAPYLPGILADFAPYLSRISSPPRPLQSPQSPIATYKSSHENNLSFLLDSRPVLAAPSKSDATRV